MEPARAQARALARAPANLEPADRVPVLELKDREDKANLAPKALKDNSELKEARAPSAPTPTAKLLLEPEAEVLLLVAVDKAPNLEQTKAQDSTEALPKRASVNPAKAHSPAVRTLSELVTKASQLTLASQAPSSLALDTQAPRLAPSRHQQLATTST